MKTIFSQQPGQPFFKTNKFFVLVILTAFLLIMVVLVIINLAPNDSGENDSFQVAEQNTVANSLTDITNDKKSDNVKNVIQNKIDNSAAAIYSADIVRIYQVEGTDYSVVLITFRQKKTDSLYDLYRVITKKDSDTESIATKIEIVLNYEDYSSIPKDVIKAANEAGSNMYFYNKNTGS